MLMVDFRVCIVGNVFSSIKYFLHIFIHKSCAYMNVYTSIVSHMGASHFGGCKTGIFLITEEKRLNIC